MHNCVGRATVVDESGSALMLDLDMETDAVVVVSAAWDAGWRAWGDGEGTDMMPANHALRAVRVGKRTRRPELRYAPQSFTPGIRLVGGAAAALGVWGAAAAVARRRREQVPGRPA